MSVVLCVAEKPSVASALAKLLGTPVSDPRGEKKQRLPVYHVRGKLKSQDVIFRVTSVAG
jgi:DNA topoisomerase IA